MASAPAMKRALCATLLALLLAVRSLSPAGFMPSFEQGRLAIVTCPDASPMPMAGYSHGDHDKARQQCPYVAASSLGALGASFGSLLEAPVLGDTLRRGVPQTEAPTLDRRLRPPTRAPPLSA